VEEKSPPGSAAFRDVIDRRSFLLGWRPEVVLMVRRCIEPTGELRPMGEMVLCSFHFVSVCSVVC